MRAGSAAPPVIRVPLATRIGAAVLGLLAGSLAVSVDADAARRGEVASSLLISALIVGAAGVYVRVWRTRVVLGPDDLIVRNFWGTHRVPRMDIAGFRVGRQKRNVYLRTIYVRARDGRELVLNVFSIGFTAGSSSRWLDRMADVLSEWNATGNMTRERRSPTVKPSRWLPD